MNKGAKPKTQVQKKQRAKRQNSSRVITTRDLHGGKFSPASNPPDVTAQPWYPLTLSWVTKPATTKLSTIIDIFHKQLDPNNSGLNQTTFDSNTSGSFRVQFRFVRVSVWNLTGRALSLTVWDDIEESNTDKDQLGGWTDCGGSNCFPAIGFVYPASHQARVYRPDPKLKETAVFNTTASSANDQILSHLYILWRFDGAVKALAVIKTPAEEVLDEIKTISESVAASQPSTVQRVIDGFEKTAAVVAAVSGTNFASAVSDHNPEADRLVELVLRRLALAKIGEHLSNRSSDDGMSSFIEP